MKKLSDIAKQVLSEDTWGNNPSAAGSMSPGRSPSTTPPPAGANIKFFDLKQDYGVFQNTIEKQEESAKQKLSTDLSEKFENKKVTVRASKGAIGQVEKDYTFVVVGIDIVYIKDKFYIVLKGNDKSDYYVNTEFKVKVDATAPKMPTMGEEKPEATPESAPKPEPAIAENKNQEMLLRSIGGIVYPQVMGFSPKGK